MSYILSAVALSKTKTPFSLVIETIALLAITTSSIFPLNFPIIRNKADTKKRDRDRRLISGNLLGGKSL